MIVGLSDAISASTDHRFDWTCPEGGGGEILGVYVPQHLAASFWVVAFGVLYARGGDDWLVRTKETMESWATPTGACKTIGCAGAMPTPQITSCLVCGSRDITRRSGSVDAVSFNALAAIQPVDWDIDVGDTLVVTVLNLSSHNQYFSMGIRLGDRGVSREPLWWADVETGRLERSLTFPERRLPKGTKIGGLVVVDPATYDGFDMKATTCS